MIARVVLVGWLTIVWVALWGDLAVGTAVAGVLAGIALVARFPPTRPLRFVVRPFAVMRFLVVFAWQLVVASAVVAWEVITPRNRINEGIVEIPVRGASELVTAVVANAISLTPGTLTIEIDRPRGRLYVHVLHLHDVEQVRADIRALEALVIRAFGSERSIASLDLEKVSPLGEDDS